MRFGRQSPGTNMNRGLAACHDAIHKAHCPVLPVSLAIWISTILHFVTLPAHVSSVTTVMSVDNLSTDSMSTAMDDSEDCEWLPEAEVEAEPEDQLEEELETSLTDDEGEDGLPRTS